MIRSFNKTFPNGITVKIENNTVVEPPYMKTFRQIQQARLLKDLSSGLPVPKGVVVEYQGRKYGPGKRLPVQAEAAPAADAPPEPRKGP